MQNSVFFQLFDVLTKKEAKLFYQFSKGMYEKQQVALRLLAYLVKAKRVGQKRSAFTMEELYLITFQQKMQDSKNRKHLLNTLSDLHLWLKRYLTFKELEEHSFMQKMLFLRVLLKKNLSILFLKNVYKLKIELETLKHDFWQPLRLLVVHHLIYFESISIPQKDIVPSLHQLPNYLDLFFLRAKIRYETALLELRKIYTLGDFSLPDLDLTRQAISSSEQEDTYLELYYWLSKLCEDQTDFHFRKVLQLFYSTSFHSNLDALEVFVYLNNYLVGQIRRGNERSVKDQLALFKYSLNTKILIHDGQITTSSFHNIISVACHQKEFDFAEQVVAIYGPTLRIKNAEAILQQTTARILIGRKQYSQALTLLSNITLNEVNEENNRRSYQILCLLGLQENSTLINNYCDNYLLYLKRNKSTSPTTILSIKNFILVVQKILKEIPKEEIYHFIDNTNFLSFKAWLLEYLAEN